MDSITNAFFLVQFLAVIGITLAKLYNIMSYGKFYMEEPTEETKPHLRISFLLLICFFISYFIGFIVFMLDPTTLIYSILFRLEILLVILNVLFFLIEIFIYVQKVSLGPKGSFKSESGRR